MLQLTLPHARRQFVRMFTHSCSLANTPQSPRSTAGTVSWDLPSNPKQAQLDRLGSILRDHPESGSLWEEGKGFKTEEEARGPRARELSNKGSSISSMHALRPSAIYTLHIKASNNNTITTLTKDGNVKAWASGGRCGFKHVQRSTYEAGYQCALRMIEVLQRIIDEESHLQIELVYTGFGRGREAVTDAIIGTEGGKIKDNVVRISDRTPIKIGGNKAKKTRRL